VPDNQKAIMMRKGKALLSWPPKSIIEQDLEEGDQIVYEDLTPAKQSTPIDVLAAKRGFMQRELETSSGLLLLVLDEVLDRLVAGNLLKKADLSEAARATLQRRETLRAQIAQIDKDIAKITPQ